MGRIGITAALVSFGLNALILKGVVALDNGLALTPQMGWVRM